MCGAYSGNRHMSECAQGAGEHSGRHPAGVRASWLRSRQPLEKGLRLLQRPAGSCPPQGCQGAAVTEHQPDQQHPSQPREQVMEVPRAAWHCQIQDIVHDQTTTRFVLALCFLCRPSALL